MYCAWLQFQLMRRLFATTALALAMAMPLSLPVVAAAAAAPCPSGQVAIGVPITSQSGAGSQCVDNSGDGVIVNYLKPVLQFLSGAVGAVVVLLVMIAGIQYIISNGDPSAITNAKNRLINAITALVLFVLAFAILSFVVPGGIL